MRMLNKIRNWLFNGRKKPARYSLQCDETGVTQTVESEDNNQIIQFAWSQVTSVFAYKRDCFTVGQICLVLEVSNVNGGIEVREDDDGYKHLIEQLPTRLDGFPTQDEWWQGVALPPFETRWSQLYSRKSQKRHG
jgi:hypothetical protein